LERRHDVLALTLAGHAGGQGELTDGLLAEMILGFTRAAPTCGASPEKTRRSVV
jgi:hypothetical protein